MEKLEDKSLFNKFDKWKATQSEQKLKDFYAKLDKVNGSYREFLELKCDILNKDAVGGQYVVVEIEGHLYIEWREKL